MYRSNPKYLKHYIASCRNDFISEIVLYSYFVFCSHKATIRPAVHRLHCQSLLRGKPQGLSQFVINTGWLYPSLSLAGSLIETERHGFSWRPDIYSGSYLLLQQLATRDRVKSIDILLIRRRHCYKSTNIFNMLISKLNNVSVLISVSLLELEQRTDRYL